MSEMLKREVSLTVLEVRLVDAAAIQARSSSESSPQSASKLRDPRVSCKLQFTGRAEQRELADLTVFSDIAPSRRRRNQSGPSYEMSEGTEPSPSSTLAQWTLHPQEILLPLQYGGAAQFTENPVVRGWLANMARGAVSGWLSDRLVRSLERFAATSAWLPSGRPTLPLSMVQELQSLLKPVLRDGDCLWLELAEPVGYLPLLPWEEMLAPAVDVPVLRLSPHALKAVSPGRELSVALCVSLPLEKGPPARETLATLMQAILKSLPERSTLHVFGDARAHAACVEASKLAGSPEMGGRPINVHDVPQAHGEDDEAWTSWVTQGLAGKSADIVHFYASAFLFPVGPRLVVLRDPGNDSEPGSLASAGLPGAALRYVTSGEFSHFLTQLGAWGALFSLLPGGLDQDRMALRLFTDQIGRLRPGIAVFHDSAADSGYQGLEHTYKFMIDDSTVRPARSAAFSVYCHPASAITAPAAPRLLPPELLQQYDQITKSIELTLQREHALPAWMAALQRTVENAMSRAAAAPPSSNNDAALQGIGSAMKYVEQVFAQRASATSAFGTAGSGDQEKDNAGR